MISAVASDVAKFIALEKEVFACWVTTTAVNAAVTEAGVKAGVAAVVYLTSEYHLKAPSSPNPQTCSSRGKSEKADGAIWLQWPLDISIAAKPQFHLTTVKSIVGRRYCY